MNKKALTEIEKKYIKLWLSEVQRTKGKVNPPDFETLAKELDRSVQSVTNFANKLPEIIISEPEIKKEPPKLTQFQKNIRNVMTGPTVSGKQNVTIMSEASSTMIEESAKFTPPTRTPKYEKDIFRGNK